MVRLSLEAVRKHTFAKQLATHRRGRREVVDVARALVGLHSARLPSPYVTLAARIDRFAPDTLREAVYRRRHAIKLRCMRRTLHIVPIDLAPIVHAATLRFRVQDKQRVIRKLSVSTRSVARVREAITNLLADSPRSPREIETSLCPTGNRGVSAAESAHLVRAVTKLMWEEGAICYLNESSTWLSEQRRFGLTVTVYPSLVLNHVPAADATRELVYRHIHSYGPVAEEDVAWWSGLPLGAIRTSVRDLLDRVIHVRVPGLGDDLLMSAEAVHEVHSCREDEEPWLRLLAYEDSSLKGYFATRHRYVDPEHYQALFNLIGEVRPSIVLNGRVIGIWRWERRSRTVVPTLFKPVSKSTRVLLANEIANIEGCFVHE